MLIFVPTAHLKYSRFCPAFLNIPVVRVPEQVTVQFSAVQYSSACVASGMPTNLISNCFDCGSGIPTLSTYIHAHIHLHIWSTYIVICDHLNIWFDAPGHQFTNAYENKPTHSNALSYCTALIESLHLGVQTTATTTNIWGNDTSTREFVRLLSRWCSLS